MSSLQVTLARQALRTTRGRDPGPRRSATIGALILRPIEAAVRDGGLAAGAATAQAIVGTSAVPCVASPDACSIARHIVSIANGDGPLATTCLPRALALWVALRSHGHPALMRIGVRPTAPQDGFSHAWVEVGGTSVLERDEPTALYALLPLQGHYPAELMG